MPFMIEDAAKVSATSKSKKNAKTSRHVKNTIIYIILGFMALVWLLPIVWLLLQSFSNEPGMQSVSSFIPTSFTFNNYIYLFQGYVENLDGVLTYSQFNFLGMFANTLIIAVVDCVVSTLFVLLTSFAFSRLRFKARQPMMKIILILGMFPGFLSMIVLYQVLKLFGMIPSLSGLIICYVGGAGMGYYVSKGFFDTIPKSIDEAAKVDGASQLKIFWSIILPLAKPIIIYTVLTSFIAPWGEYILASYLFGDNSSFYTVAVGLSRMIDIGTGTSSNAAIYWKQFCAGSVVVAIPISILFIIMQKYYVSGVTGGSVKG